MQNMYTAQLKPSQYPDIQLDINPYCNAIRTAHAGGRRDEIPICKSCDQFAWR